MCTERRRGMRGFFFLPLIFWLFAACGQSEPGAPGDLGATNPVSDSSVVRDQSALRDLSPTIDLLTPVDFADECPDWEIQPAGVYFGVVRVGAGATAIVKFVNHGRARRSLIPLGVSGTNAIFFDFFSKVEQFVDVGGSISVSVVYRPLAAGEHHARLLFRTSDGMCPLYVLLTGTAR